MKIGDDGTEELDPGDRIEWTWEKVKWHDTTKKWVLRIFDAAGRLKIRRKASKKEAKLLFDMEQRSLPPTGLPN